MASALARGRWRRWLAVAAVIGILLPAVAGAAGCGRAQGGAAGTAIILVADFAGPDPAKHRVTEAVIDQVRRETRQYRDVRVRGLGRAIDAGQGSRDACAEGQRLEAALVLWGDYRVDGQDVVATVHFELLRFLTGAPGGGPAEQAPRQGLMESFAISVPLKSELRPAALLAAGAVRYAMGDWTGAIERLSAALDQSTSTDLCLTALGLRQMIYGAQGDLARALADCERAIALKPGEAVLYHDRAVTYAQQGDFSRAIADLDQAIALDPQMAEALCTRGTIYGSQGDLERALADFDRAIAARPDLAVAYYDRAFAWSGLGDLDKAIADLDQAIALQPDFTEAHYTRGLAQGEKGDPASAIESFDHAIALNPAHAAAYYERGRAYAALGALPQAVSDFDRVIALEPGNAGAYLARGTAHALQDDLGPAIADFNQAAALKLEVPDLYCNRGMAYSQQGDLARAIADFDRAAALDPGMPQVYWGYGLTYIQQGADDKASAALQRFLELSDDQEARQAAEAMLQELGGKK